jgi:hypothetical protein
MYKKIIKLKGLLLFDEIYTENLILEVEIQVFATLLLEQKLVFVDLFI